MPRATWTGSVSFGLINIPVQLYGAASDKDVSFNRLHAACHTKLKQRNVCPTCSDMEVEASDMEKGYAISKTDYVVVTDDELASLPVPSKHTIELRRFIPATEIDPVYMEKPYYLLPNIEAGALKPYALLLRAMQSKDVFGLGKIALRNKERLCVVRATDRALVLETLFWPDEVRLYEEVTGPPEVVVSSPEIAMATTLIDMLTEPFEPAAYTDQYRTELLGLIAAKTQGLPSPAESATTETTAPIDLMAALQASLAAAS